MWSIRKLIRPKDFDPKTNSEDISGLPVIHSKFKRIVQRYAGSNPDTENPLYALNILRAFEVFDSNAAFRDSL